MINCNKTPRVIFLFIIFYFCCVWIPFFFSLVLLNIFSTHTTTFNTHLLFSCHYHYCCMCCNDYDCMPCDIHRVFMHMNACVSMHSHSCICDGKCLRNVFICFIVIIILHRCTRAYIVQTRTFLQACRHLAEHSLQFKFFLF